jgi:O-antigen/teichoic acid export membrane protein
MRLQVSHLRRGPWPIGSHGAASVSRATASQSPLSTLAAARSPSRPGLRQTAAVSAPSPSRIVTQIGSPSRYAEHHHCSHACVRNGLALPAVSSSDSSARAANSSSRSTTRDVAGRVLPLAAMLPGTDNAIGVPGRVASSRDDDPGTWETGHASVPDYSLSGIQPERRPPAEIGVGDPRSKWSSQRGAAGARWLRQAGTPVLRSGATLLLGAGLTAALGLPYWVLAARSYSTAEVGATAALLSTMFFVSAVTQLGLSGVLVRLIPVAGGHVRRVLVIAYGATTLAGAVAATAVVVTVQFWSPSLSHELRDPMWAVAFVAGTVVWNIFVIQDTVLAGLRRAPWVPAENVSYSVAKIVLLLLFARIGWSLGIFGSWVIPAGIAVIVVTAMLFSRVLPAAADQRDHTFELPSLRRAVGLSLGNQIGILVIVGSSSLMPVLIFNRLGAEATATFYAAWLIAAVLPLVAQSFSISLTVEGATPGADTRRLLREAVIGIYSILLPMVAVIVVAAPWLLRLFGDSYSQDGATVLRLLAVAAIPNVVVGVSQSVARIRDTVAIIAAGQSVIAVVTIVIMVLLLRPVGIAAGGIAWLVGQVVGAAVFWRVVICRELDDDRRSTGLPDAGTVPYDVAIPGPDPPGPCARRARTSARQRHTSREVR